MNFSDREVLWEILKDARVLTRQEREQQILREIQRYDSVHLLTDLLEQHFQTSALEDINDNDFNAAATLAWILIRRLRKSETGSVH